MNSIIVFSAVLTIRSGTLFWFRCSWHPDPVSSMFCVAIPLAGSVYWFKSLDFVLQSTWQAVFIGSNRWILCCNPLGRQCLLVQIAGFQLVYNFIIEFSAVLAGTQGNFGHCVGVFVVSTWPPVCFSSSTTPLLSSPLSSPARSGNLASCLVSSWLALVLQFVSARLQLHY